MINGKSIIKLLSEIGPLIVFFFGYKFYGLKFATCTMMIVTIMVVSYDYINTRKIAFLPLISGAILGIFGMLTLISGNMIFIKIKPTIVNGLFSLTLLIGALMRKGFLKYIIGHAISLPENKWIILSIRWGIFFGLLALSNELVWRNYSESIWVTYKVFGMMGLTFVFILSQIPFIYKNRIE